MEPLLLDSYIEGTLRLNKTQSTNFFITKMNAYRNFCARSLRPLLVSIKGTLLLGAKCMLIEIVRGKPLFSEGRTSYCPNYVNPLNRNSSI